MVKWLLFAGFVVSDDFDRATANALIKRHVLALPAFTTEVECLAESAILQEQLRAEVYEAIDYSGRCYPFTREEAEAWGFKPEKIDLWYGEEDHPVDD